MLQFAQFSLSCACGALFAIYVLGYAARGTLLTICQGLLVCGMFPTITSISKIEPLQLGFGVAFVFLFGNEMLLISLFLSSLVALLVSIVR